jgi:hypothetical protein
MANVKINQLPLATTPLTGTEVFPLVQGTTTKQVSVANLFTSPVMVNPTLGTVGQADLSNATGLPISTGVAGLGSGIATFLGTPSSANLRAAVTDETGTGALVFATSPTLVTPNLGTPTFLVATNATGTALGLIAGSAVTNANLTGAVTSVGNATSLGSFTSAQLRTALTDETGSGVAVFATSPTITAPVLNQINDTNGNQIVGLSPTASAVDYVTIKNGIGTGVPLHVYADGSSTNIGLHIQPKGSGLVTISDGTDFNKGIRFRSSGSAASAVTLLDAVATAGRVVTLPDATTTLVGRDTTDTLTNKTIAFGSNTFSGSLAIANGGTGQATANAAFNALAPSQTGNSGKYLTTDGTDTSWASNPLGTVTSVGGTGTVSGITLSGTVTTSGNLTLGGTLDLSAYNGAGAFTTLSASSTVTLSGGTANGVTYLNGSKVLTSGSALVFDGTNLGIGASPTFALDVVNSSLGIIRIKGGTGTNQGGSFFVQYAGSSNTLAAFGDRARFFGGTPDQLVGLTSAVPLTFDINGSEQMRLTSTGLGIGTSSPTTNLEIRATSPTALFSNSATRYGYVQWENSGSQLRIGTDGAFNIRFDTNASQKMLLDSAGNLGLGVTPSAWSTTYRALQVGQYNYFAVSAQESSACEGNLTWNAYSTGNETFAYKNTGDPASRFRQSSQFSWHLAGSGTAGASFTFTQAMTLDASGNLGIGTTTTTGYILRVNAASPLIGMMVSGTQAFTIGALSGGGGAFYYGAGNYEAARIDSSGNLLIGTQTASAKLTVDASSGDMLNLTTSGTASGYIYTSASTTTSNAAFFIKNSSGVGSISCSSVATAYNTSSDYRLKDNQQPLTGSGSFIDALQPKTWSWKADGSKGVGFIAHEAQTVSPSSVTGNKDAVDEDGKPIMQAMEYGSAEFIANIIAELQSLRQRVAVLEAK